MANSIPKILESYCQHGWKLLPVSITPNVDPNTGDVQGTSKRPLIKDWPHNASSDIKIIAEWLQQFKNCAWGVQTGAASGIFVVDLDTHTEPSGLSVLQEYCAAHGHAFPETMTQETGTGGLHLVFKAPEGQKIGNKTGILKNIDVRGEHGYFVVAPSINPATGKAYQWRGKKPISDAPRWLLDLICKKDNRMPTQTENATQTGAQAHTGTGAGTPYGQKALAAEIAELRQATEGSRNDALNRAGVKLFALAAGGELDADVVTEELEAAAEAIGLPYSEAAATIASARKAASPRTAPKEQGAGASPADAGEGTSIQTKYRCLNIADFITKEYPPRDMLLTPVIALQSLSMVFASRGIGKTYWALSVAYAVASGGGVFGRWFAPKPARVLYIDGEMPAVTLQERLRSLAISFESDIADPDFLRILTPDEQADAMPNLATLAGQAAIEPFLDGVSLVVVDNLATLARTGKSNDEDSWMPVQGWLLSLRRRGISVLLVHHTGKSGEQRGTAAKEDILDTVIRLKRPADYHADEGCRFEVHFSKARGLFGEDCEPFEAKLETDQHGNLVWMTRKVEDVELQNIEEMLLTGMSERDIADELSITKSKVHRVREKLKSQGKLKREY